MLREGDWILIRYEDRKYLKPLDPSQSLSVKRDVLKFSELVGKPPGIKIGKFEIFRPSLEDIIVLGFERKTQIIYPKDAFYIAFKLGITRSSRVLEFGTGSGALCAVLSQLAGEVHTYEAVEKFYRVAKRNLERFGLGGNVFLNNLDFSEAQISPDFFDSAFVDVKNPVPHLEKLHRPLKYGSPAGFLLPTANQVVELLSSLRGKFGGVEVLEIMVRFYKTVPERFRPEDTMVGHTAYLLFCRKLIP